ncbi:MAG TPA: SDR family oxidoreductase [Gemmatimonadaceae bacterium]|jgi:3-oxoacyl-[acyl-carrier protein] reductase|nr:SDR family oxidoreductase [Gemmatimonadaceae bacterium]
MDLKTAKALVTGGSSGIGYATAQLLRDRGAEVAICGRRAEAVDEAASELGALGIVCDVSREEEVVRMVQRVISELGDYNVLVNNAGWGHWAPLVETTVSDFTRVWETNVLGAMLVARESAKHFVKKNTGNIVNIASTSGQRGGANGTIYTSTKFALSGMTECWRAELRKNNIRVMQVNPSEVQTNFFVASGRGARAANSSKLQGEDIAQTIASMLEMDDRGMIVEATVWATNPRD